MQCNICKLEHEYGSPAKTPCVDALRSRIAELEGVNGKLREALFNSYADIHNKNGWHRGDFENCLMSTCVHNRALLAATASIPVEG